MRYALVGIVIATLATLAGHTPSSLAAAACADCPPAYCEDATVAQRLKAAKKAQAEARGLPARLSALYDQLPNCAACIEQAPDWPYLIWRYDVDAYEETYGIKRSPTAQMAWSRNTEQQARNDMRSGLVVDYHVTLASKPCYCCSDATGGEQSWSRLMSPSAFGKDRNYNAELKLVTTSALQVNQSSLGDDDPADLSEIPRALAGQQPVPREVDDFLPQAPLRVLQVSCPDCQDKADAYNGQAEKVNRARWDLATRQRDLAYERAMIQWRWKQEDRLRGLANTPENAERIDANNAERDAGYKNVERIEQSIEAAQAALKSQEAELQSAMSAVRECDPEQCAAEVEPAGEIEPEDKTLLANATADPDETSALQTPGAPLGAEAEVARQTLQTNATPGNPLSVPACPKCNSIRQELTQLQDKQNALLPQLSAALEKAKRVRKEEVGGLIKTTALEYNDESHARSVGGESLARQLREAEQKASQADAEYGALMNEHNKLTVKIQDASYRLDACERACAMETGEYTPATTLGAFYTGGVDQTKLISTFGFDRREWVDIVTNCEACQSHADAYNAMMRRIKTTREELRNLVAEQQRRLSKKYLSKGFGSRKDGKLGEHSLSLIFKYALESDAIINSLRELLETQEAIARELAGTLQACEASCVESRTGTTVSLAGGVPAPVLTKLPFDWQGPYSTNCWYCEKLAAELNRLPGLARERLITIATAEATLAHLRARLEFGSTLQIFEVGGERFTRKSDVQAEIEFTETKAAKARQDLVKITNQFNTVLQMLNDCENLPQCTAVYKDPVVELQQTFTRLGFNGFSIPDVIGLRSGVDVPQPPVTPPTQPPVTPPTQPPVTPPTQPPVTPPTQPPVTPPTQPPVTPPVQPPAPTPLQVTVTGFFSFLHNVGPTICPTPAGTAQISSNNGNPLRVDNVMDSGAIASRLDQQVVGNNTANPAIDAEFNCSSPQAGNFMGTVTATVTDTVTNESQTISIPAEGEVN